MRFGKNDVVEWGWVEVVSRTYEGAAQFEDRKGRITITRW